MPVVFFYLYVENEYFEKYLLKSRSPLKETLKFQKVLRGKIEFVGMVKGKEDSIYQKYINQYKILSGLSMINKGEED